MKITHIQTTFPYTPPLVFCFDYFLPNRPIGSIKLIMLLIYLIGTLKWVEFDVSINSSYWWHDFKKRTKCYCQM